MIENQIATKSEIDLKKKSPIDLPNESLTEIKSATDWPIANLIGSLIDSGWRYMNWNLTGCYSVKHFDLPT